MGKLSKFARSSGMSFEEYEKELLMAISGIGLSRLEGEEGRSKEDIIQMIKDQTGKDMPIDGEYKVDDISWEIESKDQTYTLTFKRGAKE